MSYYEQYREALARANEAARLSADARDRADDLQKIVGQLREQVENLERDRMDRDAWACRVARAHNLPPEPDPYQLIEADYADLNPEGNPRTRTGRGRDGSSAR